MTLPGFGSRVPGLVLDPPPNDMELTPPGDVCTLTAERVGSGISSLKTILDWFGFIFRGGVSRGAEVPIGAPAPADSTVTGCDSDSDAEMSPET